jgi:selenoprotein W-related protein
MQKTPRIEIEYCTRCRWLLRAAWMAQELLTTFSTEIGEVALMPGTGGIFEISVGDDRSGLESRKDGFRRSRSLSKSSGIVSRQARTWAIPIDDSVTAALRNRSSVSAAGADGSEA